MTNKLILNTSGKTLEIEECYQADNSLDLSIFENGEFLDCIFLDIDNLKLLYSYVGDYIKEAEEYYEGFSPNKNFKIKVESLFESISKMLVAKNKAYGDSALNPVSVFSKADSTSVISQQIDHKLSRIKNSSELSQNDVGDLIGYLTLLCLDQGWKDFDKQ